MRDAEKGFILSSIVLSASRCRKSKWTEGHEHTGTHRLQQKFAAKVWNPHMQARHTSSRYLVKAMTRGSNRPFLTIELKDPGSPGLTQRVAFIRP